jgi:uncharacterized protein
VEFDRFTITLLVHGPNAGKVGEAERAALQDAHLAHLADLHEAGHLFAGGPLGSGNDDEPLRGLSILGVEPERARALKEADAAVQAGVFSVRVLPWMVPAGAVTFSPTRFPRSIADVVGDLA